jgi:hypothetical protein
VNVQVAEPASVPLTASSLSLPVMLGLGLLAGLSVGIIVTLARAPSAKQRGLDPSIDQTDVAVRLADQGRPSLEPMRAGQIIDSTHGPRSVNRNEGTERP